VSKPTIVRPNNGEFTDSIIVTITTTTEGAMITYTLDEADPTEPSSRYTVPFVLKQSTTVKARAFKEGWEQSDIASATFTSTRLMAPTIAPDGGSYIDSVVVTLSTPSEADMYYTVDESEPDMTSGTEYTGPFILRNSATVKARAIKAPLDPSEISIAVFEVASPNPDSGLPVTPTVPKNKSENARIFIGNAKQLIINVGARSESHMVEITRMDGKKIFIGEVPGTGEHTVINSTASGVYYVNVVGATSKMAKIVTVGK
jgi:hypothetical protein